MQALTAWLWGGDKTARPRAAVLLRGDASASARGVPGFSDAEAPAVRLDAAAGETLGAVLERFNAYRGPASRIARVWHPDGRPADAGLRLAGGAELLLVVRAASVAPSA